MAMFPITTETTNFCRIGILVVDVCPAILRDLLDCRLPPANFVKTLQANKSQLQRIFNKSQWTLFYGGGGTPTSKDCDVSLLYSLLRNVSGLPFRPMVGVEIRVQVIVRCPRVWRG